jgi:hypothetical protein
MCRLGDTDRTSDISKKGKTDISPKVTRVCESGIKRLVVARLLSNFSLLLLLLLLTPHPSFAMPAHTVTPFPADDRQLEKYMQDKRVIGVCHLPATVSSITTHIFIISTIPSSSPLCSGMRSLPPMHHNSLSPPPATTPHVPLPARTIGYSSSWALVLYIPPSRPSSMPNSSEPKFPLGKTW